MKKQILSLTVLASLGMASVAANAVPAQGLLEWTGFVDGVFNSQDIALTGQGGGEIQKGLLDIEPTGEFQSQRAIVVEAHESIDVNGDGSLYEAGIELYNGNVDWNITAQSISHPSYDVSDVIFKLNNEPMVSGTAIQTTLDNHIIGMTASSVTPADVLPGDPVQVSATILAAPGL